MTHEPSLPPALPSPSSQGSELDLSQAAALAGCSSNQSRSILDARECFSRLKLETLSTFGRAVGPVVQPYLRSLATESARDSLSEPEKRALQRLALLETQATELVTSAESPLKPLGASAELLLRDAFYCILDQANDRASDPLVFRATVCPDYPTDDQGRYLTRGGLGTAPGLSALKIFEGSLALIHLMTQNQLPVVLELCYADIEALDPVMISKSGVAGEEFLERVRQSAANAQMLLHDRMQALGVGAAVRAGSMIGLLGETDSSDALTRLSGASITSSQVQGIATFRSSFYGRFFQEQARGQDLGEFFQARAAKDIDDHLRLGQVTARERSDGVRVTLVTMSVPALARYLRHGNAAVPVLGIQQSY
ncbi:MAG: hypothetical protein J0M12_02215 [Deltaproteobacteria bacterium]|nr:hypothetical protein [Deltaproteobacteria bacterium]